MSSETSDGAVFATGAHAGYLAIQPLMVVAQEEWSDEWISGYTGENGLLESRLRRIVVEVPVNKLLGAGDESRGSVGSVSRYCAVESIGQGLCIGVLGAEVQEIVSPRRARVSDEAESQDGEDNDDDDDEEDGGDASTDEEQALSVESDVIHDSQRRIRLLGIRTEALAEFMRKEFEGFKMPPTIMF